MAKVRIKKTVKRNKDPEDTPSSGAHREFVRIKLLSPLAHGAFGPSTGNSVAVRRIAVVAAEGMPEVPALSGNALRGTMRRALFRALFARLGINRDSLSDRRWDRLYAALANGGTLTGGEKGVDPERLRELRANIPPLSLFGSAMYTYMLPGHMSVGICWPKCMETCSTGLVPGESETPAEDLVEELSLVRHVDRDQQDPAVTAVTPMPVTFEVIKAGAVLVSEFIFAPHATEVERSAAAWALDAITTLGGKGSSGHGRVLIDHQMDSEPYQDWLSEATVQPLLDLAADL